MEGVTAKLKFRTIPGRYAVCRLAPDLGFPPQPTAARFWSGTRTREELSIVCDEAAAPAGARVEMGWAMLMLAGPFDFALTGILASVLDPLARAGVSIFALSTFDTDYVLLPAAKEATAIEALLAAGHERVE
jgi:hypothetical protein